MRTSCLLTVWLLIVALLAACTAPQRIGAGPVQKAGTETKQLPDRRLGPYRVTPLGDERGRLFEEGPRQELSQTVSLEEAQFALETMHQAFLSLNKHSIVQRSNTPGDDVSRYFIMYDDVSLPGRWELGNPVDTLGRRVDPWQFDRGQPLNIPDELIFPLRRPGYGLDFCEAGFAIPLASQRLRNLFQGLGVTDVQFLSARVETHTEPYFVLNTTRLVDCIDEGRSLRAERWKPEDGHPERTGEYRVIEGMRINPTKVGGGHLFRTWGWPVLVVSEELRHAMEQEALTGPRFVEV